MILTYLEDLVEVHDVRVAQLEENFGLARVEVALQQVLGQLSRVRDLYGHLRAQAEGSQCTVDCSLVVVKFRT